LKIKEQNKTKDKGQSKPNNNKTMENW
jgi:hypothetical protein